MKKELGRKFWAAMLIFGLVGQIAWVVENMYFATLSQDIFAASGKPEAVSVHLLLRLPRLPSMLRFRSAILPSEAVINCLSLSSKDSSSGGVGAA